MSYSSWVDQILPSILPLGFPHPSCIPHTCQVATGARVISSLYWRWPPHPSRAWCLRWPEYLGGTQTPLSSRSFSTWLDWTSSQGVSGPKAVRLCMWLLAPPGATIPTDLGISYQTSYCTSKVGRWHFHLILLAGPESEDGDTQGLSSGRFTPSGRELSRESSYHKPTSF